MRRTARDSNDHETAWRRKPCPALMFFNGAQTIVKHYRARNAARADFGSDRLELQVRKEGMKR